MKKIISIAFVVFGIALVSLFQNCSKVSVRELDTLNVSSLGIPGGDNFPDTGNPDIDNLFKSCADAKSRGLLRVKKINVNFEDPANTCDWGANGNLTDRNGYIRARTEQLQTLSIPTGATLLSL